ncbi:MAG: hypothetical protein ABSD90_00410 [Methylocystis sp.]
MALAPSNDPFYAGGTESSKAAAEWFAALYHRFGFTKGSHLRRVHYRVVSQEKPVLLPDGTPYENTEACWQKLIAASKPARYLGLVPITDFADKRNPDPVINLRGPTSEPYITTLGGELEIDIIDHLPSAEIYLWAPLPSPFHIELWCEKSTVNDVLLPLASGYGLNIQTGLGEMSLSACRDLVARVQDNGGRPVRIFYLSDFDPAGQSMPVATARKIEWLLHQVDDAVDLDLQPIALTHEQCVAYRLPRTPLKETESRAALFEARFGEGATELDALEALHHGVLREIIINEIERFIDPTLSARRAEGHRETWRRLREITEETRARYGDQRYELEKRLDALRAEAAMLRRDSRILTEVMIAEMVEQAQPLVVDLPSIEPRDADEWESPLFESARDYLAQIDAYKEFQGKPTSRKGRRSHDL